MVDVTRRARGGKTALAMTRSLRGGSGNAFTLVFWAIYSYTNRWGLQNSRMAPVGLGLAGAGAANGLLAGRLASGAFGIRLGRAAETIAAAALSTRATLGQRGASG